MKSIEPLVKMTSDVTQIPQEQVEDAVDHMFSQLRANLAKPQKSVIRIEELGRFEVKPSVIRRWLLKLLKELKEDRNNEELKRLFGYWWKVRQDALKYYENKKRK